MKLRLFSSLVLLQQRCLGWWWSMRLRCGAKKGSLNEFPDGAALADYDASVQRQTPKVQTAFEWFIQLHGGRSQLDIPLTTCLLRNP